jgi:hypothetical protein
MASRAHLPWMTDGKFDLKNCRNAVKYVQHETGLPAGSVQAHNTGTFLVVNYVKDGALRTHKIRLTAGVLYCLKPSDFKSLFSEIRGGKDLADK